MPESASAGNVVHQPSLQRTLREPAGPRGLPLVGVINQVRKDSLGFFVRAAGDHGDVARIDFGLQKMLLVSHPDGLKHVLQDNTRNYRKGYEVTKPLLGKGLVTSDGEFWLRQRRLMQPAFHRERVKGFTELMTSDTAAMLDGWAQAQREGRPLDVAAESLRLTLSIIVKTMFSRDGLTPEETTQVSADFNMALEYLTYLLLTPIRLPLWAPTATHRRFQGAVRSLESLLYRMIARRREEKEPSADLLSMLVHARDEETGEGMDDRQVRDELMTIFLAGHETTAVSLAWAWYLLSLHPDVARRLEAEVDQVLGGRVPAAEDIPRLVVTRMVLDETLRLYPSAWMFTRTAIGDDEISGYRIPAGSQLMVSPYVTHHRADLWPNPEGFDPDRFHPDAHTRRHKFAYLPFSGGPRVCIGNNFSLMESVLILAMTAQRYRLHLVPGRPVQVQPTATLRPRPGVWMTLAPRAS